MRHEELAFSLSTFFVAIFSLGHLIVPCRLGIGSSHGGCDISDRRGKGWWMGIRVPSQAKPETLVVTFETGKRKHVRAIADLVGKMYKGKPVGSVAIGENYGGMEHAQVLKYLHKAKEASLVKPVYSGPDGIIRGWVPSWVDASETMLGSKVRRAVDAVRILHKKSKQPVPLLTLAKHLNVSRSTVRRLMTIAREMGLVQIASSPWGWLPA